MNHIFLSGIVETAPILLSKDNETPHACMDLVVSHRNSSGFEKKETYQIHTWHNVALSLMKAAKPSNRVSIKGYLCQQHMENHILIYITAEEFHVSSKQPSRPMRRTETVKLEENRAKKEASSEELPMNHFPAIVDKKEIDSNETS